MCRPCYLHWATANVDGKRRGEIMSQINVTAAVQNLEQALTQYDAAHLSYASVTNGEGNLPLEWTSNDGFFTLKLSSWGSNWSVVNRCKNATAALEILRKLYREEPLVKKHLDHAASAVARGAQLEVVGTRFGKAFEIAVKKLSRQGFAEFVGKWQQLSARELERVSENVSMFDTGYNLKRRRDLYIGERLVSTSYEVVETGSAKSYLELMLEKDAEVVASQPEKLGRLAQAEIAFDDATSILKGARQELGLAKTGLEIAANNLDTTIASQQAFMTSDEVFEGFVWGNDMQVVKHVMKAAEVRSNLEKNFLAATDKIRIQSANYNVCAKNRKIALDSLVSAQNAVEYAKSKEAEAEAERIAAIRMKHADKLNAHAQTEAAARLQATAALFESWHVSKTAQPTA
jgi:hypothetical protein